MLDKDGRVFGSDRHSGPLVCPGLALIKVVFVQHHSITSTALLSDQVTILLVRT